MKVLVGDVGATNTRIAMIEAEGCEILEEEAYPSSELEGLTGALQRFTEEVGVSFAAACFGVAGPVRDGRAELTNLGWEVSAADLGEELGVPVEVINDLEAAAWSLDVLGPGDVAVIHEGAGDSPAEGNRALISPGTGLGQAGLFWDGAEHRPFATEGGHAEFAATDEVEWGLRTELAARHGRVSWERVLSGPGMVAMHRFLCSRRDIGNGCPADTLSEDDREAGPAITRGARDGSCEACAETLDRFCRLLGAETGNLALKLLAKGGVWIGGGIAPHIVTELQGGSFREAFLAKGRMREVMERIPVAVILDEKAGLRGAARVAGRLAEE